MMAPQIAQQASARPAPPDSTPGLTPEEAAAVEHTQSAQISEIVENLERRYTRDQISTADLDSRVRSFYSQFDTAHVRNFVAILVEGLVRRSIYSPAPNPRLQ